MENLDFTSDPWIALALVVFGLCLSAFFSGSETALTAASRARMHAHESAGDKRAATVTRLLASRERLIGSLLVGNNIVNVGVSAFATIVLVGFFGDAGAIYATIILSIVLIIFGEVTPKTLAIMKPDQMALLVARPVSFIVTLFTPVVFAVEAIVKLILRPFGVVIGENQSMLSAHDEIKGTVDLLHREGGVVKSDRDMLGGLLDLKELTVEDVMIHRTKMRTIDADLGPAEIVREVLASPYTRMPLWRGTSENIIGVLHAKDLLRALDAVGGDASRLNVQQISFQPWFVPVNSSLSGQLKAFLAKKTHFALAVDEYGEVMGLVTLEDILEEIVGDIKDEHDVAVQGVRPRPDGSVIVDGSVPIRDVNRAMDWSLPDEEATTIAGLVIHEARLIPEAGQAFTFYGFRFEVMRRSRNKVTSLMITPVKDKEAA
ncbi:MAG: HlyC/CorC family transporter [Beijerinckiaceae bacterium]|jgi:Mg2+/Co2+ transporter CorB|nr:HlyC/CorC family transporter [Beijerinckiaceae bacterium]